LALGTDILAEIGNFSGALGILIARLENRWHLPRHHSGWGSGVSWPPPPCSHVEGFSPVSVQRAPTLLIHSATQVWSLTPGFSPCLALPSPRLASSLASAPWPWSSASHDVRDLLGVPNRHVFCAFAGSKVSGLLAECEGSMHLVQAGGN
jgi:hypothetical protein